MLIGLTGLAGSGKSEVARLLIEECGFQRIKFADPLKGMLRKMLGDMGFCGEDVERMIEGDLKEVEIPELGVTPRKLMVDLGTAWGRKTIHPDLWVRLWGARLDTKLAGTRVVADDVRFPNEVEAIRARGGEIWRIERPGVVNSGHESESLAVEACRTITNNGTLGMLHMQAAAAAKSLFRCA